MVCEILGCLPSEIREKHPNMTVRDFYFLKEYWFRKIEKMATMLGFAEKVGTIRKR